MAYSSQSGFAAIPVSQTDSSNGVSLLRCSRRFLDEEWHIRTSFIILQQCRFSLNRKVFVLYSTQWISSFVRCRRFYQELRRFFSKETPLIVLTNFKWMQISVVELSVLKITEEDYHNIRVGGPNHSEWRCSESMAEIYHTRVSASPVALVLLENVGLDHQRRCRYHRHLRTE